MNEINKEKVIEIALSALLHDIGKFYQRTGSTLGDDLLDNSYVKDFGSYKHAGFTSKFIREYLPSLNKDKIIYPAASHHKINSKVARADHLASAHDRKSDEEEDREVEANRYDFILKRLNSIFNEISISNKTYVERQYIDVKDLDNFSYSQNDKCEDLKKAKDQYKKLFQLFADECKKIEETNLINLHHRLYPVLKKFTTSIPSATYQRSNPGFKPTVSLFDHLKLTSALASSLHQLNYQNVQESQDFDFVFLEYDLSGTQNYIYKVTEGQETKKDIAKSLRTRSFFLLLLTDLVGYKVLNDFNLSYENLLFSTGGRGIVLLPKIDNFETVINHTIEQIEKEIYSKFKVELSFSIACNTINSAHFDDYYDNIMNVDKREVIISKKQKFNFLLKDKSFSFITKELQNACRLCESDEVSFGEYCKMCNQFLKLNDILVRDQKMIVEYDFNSSRSSSKMEFDFGGLGKIKIHTSVPKITPDSFYTSINCHSLGESKYYANMNAKGKTFSEIAAKSTGDKKLGILKMDVDNLGLIFGRGINREYKTFSKILTLSRCMDYFFTRKLVNILNVDHPHEVYINYSGGDDLVLIAPASSILEIAYMIIDNFKLYTSKNSDFHLSSGIEIFNDKSPIRFAVLRADNYLNASKSIDGKNSLTIFDTTILNKYLLHVLKEIEIYENKLNNDDISRGIIYKLNYVITKSLENEKPMDYFIKYIPQLAYSFERNIDDLEEKNKLKSLFIKRDVKVEDLKLYKIIFTYALLKTRKKEGGEG